MVLSVILPVYNGEAYLKRCVESVERALLKFSELVENTDGISSDVALEKMSSLTSDGAISEIILIDDGSLDGTPKVCKELLAQYDNIKLLTLEDEGVSVARNKGLALSTGDYIAFVDADDVVDELIFSKLYTALKSNNASIAGCSFYEWSDEGFDLSKTSSDDEVTCYTPSEYIASEILYGNSRCWSKIYDRRYITEFRKGLSIGEDMLFLTDAVIKAEVYNKNDTNVTICELKKYKGYGYYKNLNGAMNRPFTPKYMDQILCWELLRDRLNESGLFNSDDDKGKAVLKKLNTNYLVSIVLTASKLALLEKSARKEYKNEIITCHSKLKAALKQPHSLDAGYKIKSGLFNLSPELYLSIYHKWKV